MAKLEKAVVVEFGEVDLETDWQEIFEATVAAADAFDEDLLEYPLHAGG